MSNLMTLNKEGSKSSGVKVHSVNQKHIVVFLSETFESNIVFNIFDIKTIFHNNSEN